jgi:hypothetical protein
LVRLQNRSSKPLFPDAKVKLGSCSTDQLINTQAGNIQAGPVVSDQFEGFETSAAWRCLPRYDCIDAISKLFRRHKIKLTSGRPHHRMAVNSARQAAFSMARAP